MPVCGGYLQSKLKTINCEFCGLEANLPIEHWACIFYVLYISMHCTRSPNSDGRMCAFAFVKGHFVYFLSPFSHFLTSRFNEIVYTFFHFPIKFNVYTDSGRATFKLQTIESDRISWQRTHFFSSIALAELMTLPILIVCWFWPLTCFRLFVGI